MSDDNAFSEAHFKTLKYQSDYPGRFIDREHARSWLADFFAWYSAQHHHHGLALLTPEDVFLGRVEAVATARQTALDAALQAHPGSFPNGPPRARRPQATVSINAVPPLDQPDADDAPAKAANAAGPFASRPALARTKPRVLRTAYVAVVAT